MIILSGLAFFVPAFTGLAYFLSGKNRYTLFILPVTYLLLAVILGVNVQYFAAEEGNLLWCILAAILFLVVFDYLYKRPVRGIGFFSGLAMALFVLLNSMLVLIGIHA